MQLTFPGGIKIAKERHTEILRSQHRDSHLLEQMLKWEIHSFKACRQNG